MIDRIAVLSFGTIKGFPAERILHGHRQGETRDLACLVFVLFDGDETIVVDTGPPDPTITADFHGYRLEQTPEQRPARALESVGVDPSRVTSVVNTHLHWDHCGNNSLFDRARFFIRARELEYAAAPRSEHKKGYQVGPTLDPNWTRVLDRIVAVPDGLLAIAPGVVLVPLPGHTPGSQGVLVRMASGSRYLLAGDTINLYESVAGFDRGEVICSGFHTSLENNRASIEAAMSLGVDVMPGHDQDVVRRGVLL